MMRTLRSLTHYAWASALLCATTAMAQQFAAPKVRIVDRIDETSLVVLRGNTHPAANAKNDLGRVSPTLPMTDLILVLSRDPAQQAAFDKFVAGQYEADSPDFHRWLTPEQVGTNFGPSETDIATISNWLTGHGFSIGEVTKDRLSIRFSGTAAQVESAFHTEIHNLSVKGVPHIANMSDPQIPAALTSVVVGVKSLHNFFPRPLHKMGHQVALSREAGGWKRIASPAATPSHLSAAPRPETAGSSRTPRSQFTINVPANGGSSGTPAYTEADVSPYDFATIYNVLPLWNKGIDGTGQTIAIAGTSDISQNDISTFRTFFGLPTNLPANTPQIVHPNPALPGGDDPGICTSTLPTATCTIDDLIENSLDTEWSGSIAKNAQIILVTASSQSATDDTLYDAESYIVNNVTAHILSVSYGACELAIGTAGNVQYNTLWQNAASEGIAVFVSSGDSGAASCDEGGDANGTPYVAEYGTTVSGLASTPYNTAVGGTDFYWCPFLTLYEGGTCSAGPSWGTSNSTPPGASNASISALGYVPEVPWNDTCTNPLMLPTLIQLAKDMGVPGVNNEEEACNLITDNAQTLNTDYPFALDLVDTVGGGGGASNCTTNSTTSTSTTLDPTSCAGGYAKPSWQAGVTGIPSDGKRDLPDVSFFASSGLISDSAYLICVSENGGSPCTYSTDAEPFASEVGGTSASTPPMAGVMALINQKAGSAQGFANPELYKLAAQQTYSSCSAESVTAGGACLFNDIDTSTNAMPCDYGAVSGKSPDCSASDSLQGSSDEVGILSGFSAGAGYDQATGLGSLNVANVVNAWPAISGGLAVTVTVTPAQTTLILSQTLAVEGTVASSPAGGTAPTGTVTLTAGTYTSTATLAAGAYSFTVPANSLGAGLNTLSVAYSGDTTYSTASGEAIVTVEGSGATFTLNAPTIAVTPAGGVAPGASASAVVTVAASSGYAGTVTVTCSLSGSPSGATDAPSCNGGGPTLAITLPSMTAQALTFTVTTTAPSTTTSELVYPKLGGKHRGLEGASGGAVLALLLFLGIPARRRSWRAMLGMLVLMAALGTMAACGGGGGGSKPPPVTDPGTSAGTYTFTVTGVGNPSVSPAVSATFTVVVN